MLRATLHRRFARLLSCGAIFFVIGLSGCAGAKVEETTLTTEEPKELQDANANMKAFMESGGGQAGAKP